MRIAIVAPSVRGAMGQYVESLTLAIARHASVILFVPEHFDSELRGIHTRLFRTGRTKVEALIRLANPVLGWRIWKEIMRVNPSVIHLFNGEGYPWSLLWAYMARHHGVPIVLTLHDPEPHPGRFWEWCNGVLRTPVVRSVDAIHVHARVHQVLLERRGILREKIHVIPHGSIAHRFLRWRDPGIQREPLVLFFGRIEPYKGLDLLVEAAFRIGDLFKVCIAGPGYIPAKLRRVIQNHAERFEVHNRYLSDREVAHLFQRATVCVMPYRQASQSSVPVISAAFGVPVVATDVGGLREEISRVNGVLVPRDDADALARAICSAVGRKPRYPVEVEFENLAGRFIEMYNSVRGSERRVVTRNKSFSNNP